MLANKRSAERREEDYVIATIATASVPRHLLIVHMYRTCVGMHGVSIAQRTSG